MLEQRIKIDGDWADAVGEALRKKRPVDDWPDDKQVDEKPEANDENDEDKKGD